MEMKAAGNEATLPAGRFDQSPAAMAAEAQLPTSPSLIAQSSSSFALPL